MSSRDGGGTNLFSYWWYDMLLLICSCTQVYKTQEGQEKEDKESSLTISGR